MSRESVRRQADSRSHAAEIHDHYPISLPCRHIYRPRFTHLRKLFPYLFKRPTKNTWKTETKNTTLEHGFLETEQTDETDSQGHTLPFFFLDSPWIQHRQQMVGDVSASELSWGRRFEGRRRALVFSFYGGRRLQGHAGKVACSFLRESVCDTQLGFGVECARLSGREEKARRTGPRRSEREETFLIHFGRPLMCEIMTMLRTDATSGTAAVECCSASPVGYASRSEAGAFAAQ